VSAAWNYYSIKSEPKISYSLGWYFP
jgi:hypothetical protein